MVDNSRTLDAVQSRALGMEGAGPVLVRGVPSVGRTTLALARIEKAVLQSSFVAERSLLITASPLAAAVARRQLVDRLGDVTSDVTISDLPSMCRNLLMAASMPARGVPEIFREGFLRDAISVVRRRGARPALDRSPTFIADEIAKVIKGRALGDRQAYLQVERGGRFRPLDARDRETFHDVYLEYQKRLEAAGYVDDEDLPIRSMKALDAGVHPRYDLVIIDDGQFLSRASLLLCRALADPVDRVFLLLDESQRLHPLGFSMREAGFEVAGRSLELTGTKRTDPALSALVGAMLAAEDGEEPAPLVATSAVRLVEAEDFLDQFAAAARAVKDLLNEGIPPAGIAVVPRHARDLAAVSAALRAAGVMTIGADEPMKFAGREAVATLDVESIRGLRFAAVVLVDVNEGTYPDASSADVADRFADRRRLRVAVSRAERTLAIIFERGRASPFIPKFRAPGA